MRPRQNGRHLKDDMSKCIFLKENVWIPIEISLKIVPKGLINNNPALFQIMAWRRPVANPMGIPILVRQHLYIESASSGQFHTMQTIRIFLKSCISMGHKVHWQQKSLAVKRCMTQYQGFKVNSALWNRQIPAAHHYIAVKPHPFPRRLEDKYCSTKIHLPITLMEKCYSSPGYAQPYKNFQLDRTYSGSLIHLRVHFLHCGSFWRML